MFFMSESWINWMTVRDVYMIFCNYEHYALSAKRFIYIRDYLRGKLINFSI